MRVTGIVWSVVTPLTQPKYPLSPNFEPCQLGERVTRWSSIEASLLAYRLCR